VKRKSDSAAQMAARPYSDVRVKMDMGVAPRAGCALLLSQRLGNHVNTQLPCGTKVWPLLFLAFCAMLSALVPKWTATVSAQEPLPRDRR
jgi:hypothetical protein